MNDPGIESIYYIKTSKTGFPLFFTPGKVVDITPYLTVALTELEFEKTTVRIGSTNEKTDMGKIVKSVVQFVVSGIDSDTEALMTALEDESHVFVLGDIEGNYLLAGTNNFKPVFTRNLVHEDPPSSKKYYTVNLTLEAPFGLIFCTI